MPFQSKAQQRFMFATMPTVAKRWADHTPDIKGLPAKKTTSDPAKTRARHKPKKQQKAASTRELVDLILATNPSPQKLKSPDPMHDLLQIAVPSYRHKSSQSSHSSLTHDSHGSQSSHSHERSQSSHTDHFSDVSQACQSILGGIIHTPKTAAAHTRTREVLASQRLRADYVAQSAFRSAVDAIRTNVNNLATLSSGEKKAVVLPPQAAQAPQPPAQSPNLQDAQAAMQQFLPGTPQIAGDGIPQTGLDGPITPAAPPADADVGRATAVPGMAGTAAANPIDMHGPLDPRGLALDGNHASGVQKGFKLAEWIEGLPKQDLRPYPGGGKLRKQ